MHKGLFSLFLAGAATISAVPLYAADISLGQVVLRGLDKVTGRLSTMTVNVGEKAEFGALDIYARVCMTHPPEETPENAAFLQVIEKKPEGQLKLFSGWMFSSSPALSAMEHPVYDVWVIKCQGEQLKPPAPAPLILDNPLEMKTSQPKLKITVDDDDEGTDAPTENVQESLSAADEATMLIRVEEEGVESSNLPVQTETTVIDGSFTPGSVPPVSSAVEVIEEPIEGNVPVLRALPDGTENVPEQPAADAENTDGTAAPHISVNDGNYVPPEEDPDTDDNIADIPDGRILHIVPSSSVSNDDKTPVVQGSSVSEETLPAEGNAFVPVTQNASSFGEAQEISVAPDAVSEEPAERPVSSPVAEKYTADPVPSLGFDELPPMQTTPDDTEDFRALSSDPVLHGEGGSAPPNVSDEYLSEEIITEETADY